MPKHFDVDSLRRRVEIHRLHAKGLSSQEISEELGMRTGHVRRCLASPMPQLADPPSSAWWLDNAACTGMDVDLFYPVIRGNGSVERKKQAQRICAGCPVRRRCLKFAQANYEQFGVWGGVDFSQFHYEYVESTGQVRIGLKERGEPVAKVS